METVPLWLSIGVLIAALAPISLLAARVLIPYLLWARFVAAPNLAVVRPNGPLGA